MHSFLMVIPPFVTELDRRTHAAILSFYAGARTYGSSSWVAGPAWLPTTRDLFEICRISHDRELGRAAATPTPTAPTPRPEGGAIGLDAGGSGDLRPTHTSRPAPFHGPARTSSSSEARPDRRMRRTSPRSTSSCVARRMALSSPSPAASRSALLTRMVDATGLPIRAARAASNWD